MNNPFSCLKFLDFVSPGTGATCYRVRRNEIPECLVGDGKHDPGQGINWGLKKHPADASRLFQAVKKSAQ